MKIKKIHDIKLQQIKHIRRPTYQMGKNLIRSTRNHSIYQTKSRNATQYFFQIQNMTPSHNRLRLR